MICLRELKFILKKMFYFDQNKTIGQKWKQSLLAIFAALLFSSILILIKGQNPFQVFYDIIYGAIKDSESIYQTLVYFSMFVVAGTAIIIGFKSGLFNIGISGQMLIAGVVTIILAIKYSLPWPLLLVISMLVGGGCAAISGALKSLFNIHEVVSTILLNWVFFYVCQYLLGNEMSWMDGVGSTKKISNSSRMMIGTSIAIPSLLIALLILLSSIILFNKTKWGFALESVGQNINASKYAGIKIVTQMMLGMGLSGMAAGTLASINYLGQFGSMSYSVGTSLPSIGFQGISVALISFNSLYGLIPAAMFWSIITSGIDYASIVNLVPKEILSLMNGLIIYSIAISIIFIRFRPIKIIMKLIIRMNSIEIKDEKRKLKISKQNTINLYNNQNIYLLKTKKNKDSITIEKIHNLKVRKKELLHKLQKIKVNYWKENGGILIKNILKSKIRNNLHLNLFCKLKESFSQVDVLNKQINNLNHNLTKKIIKINMKNMKNGLRVLDKENKKIIENIQNKISSKFWCNKLFSKYILNKKINQNFNSKYALIKLDFKQSIKKLNKIEHKKQRSKEKINLQRDFNHQVIQLEKQKKNM